MSRPKEPKYWLCDDEPPPAWRGPGDAHSRQEWVWRRQDYEKLFDDPERRPARGESTPFYLWSRSAHRRIGEALPDARLIAVVRDPIDRAYSNWMHLWSDGLEPESDFERAYGLPGRAHPGRLGALLALPGPWPVRRAARAPVPLRRPLPGSRAPLPRRWSTSLGRRWTGPAASWESRWVTCPRSRRTTRTTSYEPGWRPRVIGPVIRVGAQAGQFAAPHIWRRASAPLISRLAGPGENHRPPLRPEVRQRLVAEFDEDVRLLTELTGEDFSDWLSPDSRGSFSQRRQVTRS